MVNHERVKMKDTASDNQRNKPSCRTALGMGLFLALGLPSSAMASGDGDFWDFLLVQCTKNEGNPPPELVGMCNDALVGGGGAGAPPSNAALNTGGLGAQGRTSIAAAAQQRKGIRMRLDELKGGDGSKGGGASADESFGRWSIFASVRYTDTDRDATTLETGYDADLDGITLGGDFRWSDKAVIGLALGYTDTNLDYDRNAGDLDLRSMDITLYGNFTPMANAYIDAYAGYARLEYDTRRRIKIGLISGAAKGDTDGDQLLAGLAAGYEWSHGPWSMGPEIKLDYVSTDIDGYRERGSTGLELSYQSQDIDSLTTSMGVRISYAKAVSWGVILPQARLHYVHERKNDSRSISNSLALDPSGVFTNKTDDPDRDYMIANLGVSAVMRYGLQAFLDYEQLINHDFLDSWTLVGGIRKEY